MEAHLIDNVVEHVLLQAAKLITKQLSIDCAEKIKSFNKKWGD